MCNCGHPPSVGLTPAPSFIPGANKLRSEQNLMRTRALRDHHLLTWGVGWDKGIRARNEREERKMDTIICFIICLLGALQSDKSENASCSADSVQTGTGGN